MRKTEIGATVWVGNNGKLGGILKAEDFVEAECERCDRNYRNHRSTRTLTTGETGRCAPKWHRLRTQNRFADTEREIRIGLLRRFSKRKS